MEYELARISILAFVTLERNIEQPDSNGGAKQDYGRYYRKHPIALKLKRALRWDCPSALLLLLLRFG